MAAQNKEIAIRVSGVKKKYKLGQIGGGTLTADLQSWWARVRGREDPNTIIGADQRLVGQTFMALNGIDLTVYKGEALGIIGGNGAGKSTLLKLLCRVTAPTEGEIDLYGRVASMLEVGTGFSGEMTGRENIYMNGAILGMTKAEIDAKIENIIDFSEVRDFIDTPVKRYSSGMYVKLAFSVAAHLDSEIMIMDEVLAVGDMAFQKKCLDKMRAVARQQGRTVLYVSHNMNTIRQLCDRCVVLDRGRIVFEGDVEKAIGLYMGSANNDAVSVDVSKHIRPEWLHDPQLKILQIGFVNKKSNVFDLHETVSVRVEWKNLYLIRNLSLRIEVLNLEGMPLGTYVAYDFYSGKAGQVSYAVFNLDASSFAEGTYVTRYTFFYKDKAGNHVDAGFAYGLCFTKAAENETGKQVWNVKNWGHFLLPEPVISEIG